MTKKVKCERPSPNNKYDTQHCILEHYVPISINPADLYLQRPRSKYRNGLKLCNMSMNDFPYGVFSSPWGYAPESTCI